MKPQGQMYAQLKQVRPQIHTRGDKPSNKSSWQDPIGSPMRWKGDGVDHINIWEEGDTELGRILSHRCDLAFEHKLFGKFTTMEAFDLYILSQEKDDRLRRLTGVALKKFSTKLTRSQVTNFKAIIMDTNYQRIMQFPVIVQSIKESTLPFDVYYIIRDSGVRVRPQRHPWLLAGFEEIRKAIKEDREPDFSFLKDNKKAGIYDYVLKEVKPHKASEKAPQANGNNGGKKGSKPSALETAAPAATVDSPSAAPIAVEENVVDVQVKSNGGLEVTIETTYVESEVQRSTPLEEAVDVVQREGAPTETPAVERSVSSGDIVHLANSIADGSAH